jgi:hypothetical protein
MRYPVICWEGISNATGSRREPGVESGIAAEPSQRHQPFAALALRTEIRVLPVRTSGTTGIAKPMFLCSVVSRSQDREDRLVVDESFAAASKSALPSLAVA